MTYRACSLAALSTLALLWSTPSSGDPVPWVTLNQDDLQLARTATGLGSSISLHQLEILVNTAPPLAPPSSFPTPLRPLGEAERRAAVHHAREGTASPIDLLVTLPSGAMPRDGTHSLAGVPTYVGDGVLELAAGRTPTVLDYSAAPDLGLETLTSTRPITGWTRLESAAEGPSHVTALFDAGGLSFASGSHGAQSPAPPSFPFQFSQGAAGRTTVSMACADLAFPPVDVTVGRTTQSIPHSGQALIPYAGASYLVRIVNSRAVEETGCDDPVEGRPDPVSWFVRRIDSQAELAALQAVRD